MKTMTLRSFAVWLALAAVGSGIPARAATLPVAEDTSSVSQGTISTLTGSGSFLAANPTRQAFVRFELSDLPASINTNTFRRARLTLFVNRVYINGDLSLGYATSEWHEKTATVNVPSFVTTGAIPAAFVETGRFIVLDVTEEVDKWLKGTLPNYGFSISSAGGTVRLGAKEGRGYGFPATLEVEEAADKITDGTIVNADLAANAAIADTKLATIMTAGKVADSALSANVALRAGGNTFSGNQTVQGTVRATNFIGDGSGLTNIPASAVVATPPPGMVLIPGGSFTMGNSVAEDTDINDANPVAANVSAFYMDVNEVTMGQWQGIYTWATLVGGYTFVHAGLQPKGANHPVATVDWYDCVKWCNARSEQAGRTPVYYTDAALTAVYRTGVVTVYANWAAKGFRLPTEAEWERAARGGLSGLRFPWGNTISQKQANYFGATGLSYDLGPAGFNAIGSIGGTSPATSPVGSFGANGYGLNDMAGNIFEWCWDWYGTPYAGGADPRGPVAGTFRVNRGGDWSNANLQRCAQRGIFDPGVAASFIGFRAVLPPGQ